MGIDDDDQHDDHDYYCDDNAKQNDGYATTTDYDGGGGGMVILFGKVKCVCYSIKVLHFNPFSSQIPIAMHFKSPYPISTL